MIEIGIADDCSDDLLFANADWRLHADGLEHRDTGYFVGRDILGARRADGLWDWPLHLAEKSWCSPRLFREAFLAAVERFGIVRDEALMRSFAIGFGMRASTARGRSDFVSLGELVQPKSIARKRRLPTDAFPPLVARERVTAAASSGARGR